MSNEGLKDRIKILLIEDNIDIQEAAGLIFELHLPQAGFVQAYKGEDGLSLLKSELPDIVVLDLGLPDMDGMKVLKEIRLQSDVPVIILTVRGEETDKVRGLELGADDYIVKPFAHKELLARIETVLHRRKTFTARAAVSPVPAVNNQLKLNFSSGTVMKGESPIRLTSTELNLLKYLVSHAGHVLSDEGILAEVWGDDYIDCSEYLDVYVRRLRDKLEDNPHNPRIIVKESNGYVFVHNAS
jgi:two-component system, OmpR family, response regulator VicR